ncbi:MAG: hypothetical protein J5684_06790, partial [Eubacterium sp.]|nr:hypothetical protein [Eubacterium sp.]
LMRKIQSAWDKEAVGVDISEFKVNKRDINDLREVYKTYINQNPEYFYISSTFDYFFYEGENNIFKINFDYRVKDKSAIKKMIKEYNASIEKFKKSVNPSWSEMEKFVYIHDYLATHCEYDTSKEREHCHDAYGALVEKIAVCQGYALAVNELAESLGLESHFVTSQSMHHGWNMVKVNGKYYMMDVTWDDPTPDKVGRVRHKYLLKSMPWFNSGKGNHMTSDYIVQADILPSIANDRKYDDYILDRINVGLQYVNGTWYGLYYPDSSIYSFICDGTDWKFGDKIVNLKYSNWNADGVFYDAEVAGGLTSYRNKLYYSCIDGIYTYDFKTKKSIKVYDIPSKEKNKGVIIGIVRTEDNKMKYLLSSERSGKNGTVKIIDIP